MKLYQKEFVRAEVQTDPQIIRQYGIDTTSRTEVVASQQVVVDDRGVALVANDSHFAGVTVPPAPRTEAGLIAAGYVCVDDNFKFGPADAVCLPN